MRGIAAHWRLIPQRYNLVGTKCSNCGEKFFPPRVICPNCRRAGDIEEFRFSGEGRVYSYTVIHVPPDGFEFQKPYILGIIELAEGPRILSQIVDCKPEDVEIGSRVEKVFRKVIADGSEGIIRYGYKFKLKDPKEKPRRL
ncbi:MAG: transcriptional regulator [Candidatus Altiarchaeales archaeon ex4484_2]|nr:MAG: transcriptional regulator [Candidatus Altiarchaeales archaeon ex4484_2]